MGLNMKDIIKMVKNMERVLIHETMDLNILANGSKIKYQDLYYKLFFFNIKFFINLFV